MSFVQFLLDAGADPVDEPAANAGVTALQAACIGGYIGIACLLLSKGARINAPASPVKGRTALEGAAEYGRIDMLQMLLDNGAELYGTGERQYLQSCKLAASNGHITARDLLEFYYARPSAHLSPQLSMQGDNSMPSCDSSMDIPVEKAAESMQNFNSPSDITSNFPDQSEFGVLWNILMMGTDTTDVFTDETYCDMPFTSSVVFAPSRTS
jgi:Ankyrin repeats (3 copies)